ncbi:HNH endonuclease [Kitasatospora purpeofusca]|uniref:HNH endonuclease n=1 Tax=Kitasatospora purpeofusca TaxID=67352 RepID=UPI00365CDEB8
MTYIAPQASPTSSEATALRTPHSAFLQRVQRHTGTRNKIRRGKWVRISSFQAARFEVGFRENGVLWVSAHLSRVHSAPVEPLFAFLEARADLIQKQAGKATGRLIFDPMEGQTQARIVARWPIPNDFGIEAVAWSVLAVRKLDEALRPHLAEWYERPAVSPQASEHLSLTSTPEQKYRDLTLLVEQRLLKSPPRTREVTSEEFVRNLNAREAVLAVCGNTCENPECVGLPDGLFRDGRALLDVDHVIDLSDGGPDHPSNMVALCPNCHRMKHQGHDRKKLRRVLAEHASARHRRLVEPEVEDMHAPAGTSPDIGSLTAL